jgi:hypothetical protein
LGAYFQTKPELVVSAIETTFGYPKGSLTYYRKSKVQVINAINNMLTTAEISKMAGKFGMANASKAQIIKHINKALDTIY